LVIISGGLGPTSDDLTRAGLALAGQTALLRDHAVLERIKARYARYGRSFPASGEVMADLPDGALSIPNEAGSAPGIRMEINNRLVIAVPGVPHELRSMLTANLLGELTAVGETTVMVRSAIIGESTIADSLRSWQSGLGPHLRIAYLASLGDVRVKVTAEDSRVAHDAAENAAAIIGDSVYSIGTEGTSLDVVVHEILKRRDATVATAESLTGGGLGELLTAMPGSSATYRGGVVAYASDLKHSMLGVSGSLLDAKGAVDPEVALAMAHGVRMNTGSTWALSTTGVAGPDPSEGHAPGVVFIALEGPTIQRVISLDLAWNRDQVRRATAIHAIELLRRTLLGLAIQPGSTVITDQPDL
jgi:nicotinamide-nucleotide amidase